MSKDSITNTMFYVGCVYGSLTHPEVVEWLRERGVAAETIDRLLACLREVHEATYRDVGR